MAVRRRSEKHAVSIVETLSKRRKTEESSIAGDHVQAIMIFTVSNTGDRTIGEKDCFASNDAKPRHRTGKLVARQFPQANMGNRLTAAAALRARARLACDNRITSRKLNGDAFRLMVREMTF